jgi:hypothetical protein
MDPVTLGMAKADAKKKYRQQGLPSWATGRTKGFDPAGALYNVTPSSMAKVRAAMGKAGAGSNISLLALGHSELAGALATPGSTDMPLLLRKELAAAAVPIGGTGIVYFANNQTRDIRWTNVDSGGFVVKAANDAFATSNAAGKTVTFTSDLPGTSVKIVTFNNSAEFTYSIDGGAAVSVTPTAPPASAAVRVVTVTGLANTTHTVTITAVTTSNTYLIGVGVGGNPGLEITNAGYGGTQSASWLPGGSFTSKYTVARGACQADIVLIQLDANDGRAGVSAATFKTNMNNIIAALDNAGKAMVLCASVNSPFSENVTQAQWDGLYGALYDLADTWDLPLLDIATLLNGWTSVVALGLNGDNGHPNGAGYQVTARGARKLLLS